MLRRSKSERAKEGAVSASELARQLARDKRFRKRLLAALAHTSETRKKTRGLGLGGAARRVASDEALRAELSRAGHDLRRAYGRLEATRRPRRLRRAFVVLAGLGSIAALPQVRQRAATALGQVPEQRRKLAPLAERGRATRVFRRSSGPRRLEDLTKEELYARAQEADIPGRSEMSKDELVEALRARS
jgi:hypothetical protein